MPRRGPRSDSNVLIDLAQELRCLEYGQRLLRQSRNVLASSPDSSTGRALFDHAHGGGAQALTGRMTALEIGAPADIVTLDPEHPALVGRRADEMLDSWIFAARDTAVDCVWRRGRCVVKGGKHIRRDAIVKRYQQTIQRLRL